MLICSLFFLNLLLRLFKNYPLTFFQSVALPIQTVTINAKVIKSHLLTICLNLLRLHGEFMKMNKIAKD